MRLYLDTNILIFLWSEPSYDSIKSDVADELFDYTNTLYTSTVCVHEFIHLLQIGKFDTLKRRPKSADILDWLETYGINIVKVDERHLRRYEDLPIVGDHRDPNDRLIIAQAMEDKSTLISSDRKFIYYTHLGLDFLFNER